MLLRRTVAATTWPVSLDEAKAQCHVDFADEDALILHYIEVATAAIGEMVGRVLSPETWACSVASVSGDFVLPKRPVAALTGITYFDADDVSQTATLANFYTFIDPERAVVRPKSGYSWPVTATREDAITFTFTVGSEPVEPSTKQAILLMVEHLFQNRSAVDQPMAEVPLGLQTLVNLSRAGWVA